MQREQKISNAGNGKPPVSPGFSMRLAEMLREGVLKAIVAGILAGLGTTLLTVWILVTKWPGKIGLTPTNAVMAFDLNTCPDGWDPYLKARGRFVIGAASEKEIAEIPSSHAADTSGAALTPKTNGQPGGRQFRVYTYGAINHPNSSAEGTALVLRSVDEDTVTESGRKVHDNMPPFIALLFCKKK